MDALPDGSPLLSNIGEKFQSVGLCNEGVTAFLKAGDTKRAIDCCVLLNQWDQAVQLAQTHNFPQIEQLLAKYANHLLEKEKVKSRSERCACGHWCSGQYGGKQGIALMAHRLAAVSQPCCLVVLPVSS